MSSPAEAKIIQSSFSGGLRRSVDATELSESEYFFLANGRTRTNKIRPTKKHLDITSRIPEGLMQGIYGADNLLLVFVSGNAYYLDFLNAGMVANWTFNKLNPFQQVRADVEYVYAQLIPQSSNKYTRKLSDEGNVGGEVLLPEIVLNGSPSCAVVQDGYSRPQIIETTGACRYCKGFAEWAYDDPEYVPVGKNMAYVDGILYTVDPTSSFIFRSVQGRPLDHMVAIDIEGNPVDSNELKGGAYFTSHDVDYERIVGIHQIPSNNRGFIVSSRKSTYIVAPNWEQTVYAQPTFNNIFLFSSGEVSPNGATDIGGDTALVDFSGIKSFNAVATTSFDGKNAPFSKDVFNLFEYSPNKPVIQTVTAAITYDNYGVFGVTTIHGPAIMVYDTLIQKWISCDLLDADAGLIKQFCEIKVEGIRKLFFITTANKVFEAWGSDETSSCKLYTREWTSGDPEIETTLNAVKLLFINVRESGTVYLTQFADGVKGTRKSYAITAPTYTPSSGYVSVPFQEVDSGNTENVTFGLQSGKQGWKQGLLIEWDFDAELSHIKLIAMPQGGDVATKQTLRTRS
jgi:hypothetical protein